MSFRFTPARNCCCHECIVFEDDFNRADSTNIGGDWVEDSGGWSISSNTLAEDGTNGLVYTVAELLKTRRNVYVRFLELAVGKIYRLVFACKDDGSEYGHLQLDCTDPDRHATLSLHFSSGGAAADSTTISFDDGDNLNAFVCVSDEGTYGGVTDDFGGASAPVWDCQVLNGADYPRAGIGNAGDPAEFDNFVFARHALDIEEAPYCRFCFCECDGKCLPQTLTLTLESTCLHRDGLTITLTIDPSTYPTFTWIGTATWPEPLNEESETEYNFRLTCDNGIDGGFSLCAPEFPGGCSSDDWSEDGPCVNPGETGRFIDSRDCDPLELRFGPGTCTGSGPPEPAPSCTETLVVTI